jgi:hypothetical protein
MTLRPRSGSETRKTTAKPHVDCILYIEKPHHFASARRGVRNKRLQRPSESFSQAPAKATGVPESHGRLRVRFVAFRNCIRNRIEIERHSPVTLFGPSEWRKVYVESYVLWSSNLVEHRRFGSAEQGLVVVSSESYRAPLSKRYVDSHPLHEVCMKFELSTWPSTGNAIHTLYVKRAPSKHGSRGPVVSGDAWNTGS